VSGSQSVLQYYLIILKYFKGNFIYVNI